MKFWDSSALIPLIVGETTSERMLSVADADPFFVVWWGTHVECVSAIARLGREGKIDGPGTLEAFRGLDGLSSFWSEIDPSPVLRDIAIRLLRVHILRAGDALQLAAAVVAAENHPPSLEFVCLDERLSEAAMKEGFRVVDGSRKGRK